MLRKESDWARRPAPCRADTAIEVACGGAAGSVAGSTPTGAAAD